MVDHCNIKLIENIRDILKSKTSDKSVIKLFKKLDKLDITLDVLYKTKIGKAVNYYRKHDGRIGDMAKMLVAKWKNSISENSIDENKSKSNNGALKTETVSETISVIDKVPTIDSIANNSNDIDDAKQSEICHEKLHRKKEHKHLKKRKKEKHTTCFEDILSYDSTVHKKVKKHKHSKEKHKRKVQFEDYVPMPIPLQNNIKPAVDISLTLPDISPTYKPLPRMLDDGNKKSNSSTIINDPSAIGMRIYSRGSVFSGKKAKYVTKVPKLFDACIQVLKDNVHYIEFVGGIPTSILMPVLEICSAEKLYDLEDKNQHFLGDTDHLWKKFCLLEFKNSKPNEFESFRELYLRLKDEKEQKFLKLKDKIAYNQKIKEDPKRKTKLAFENSIAKAPRSIRRRQIQNGIIQPSLADVKANNFKIPKEKTKKLVAPLMQKTLKLMKNVHR